MIAPPSYPRYPGSRGTHTSRLAADSVRPRALTLRQRVLDLLADCALTTYELTARLAPLPYCTIQPRVAELYALGLVEPSGVFGVTPGGRKAIRWRLRSPTAPPGPAPASPAPPGPAARPKPWTRGIGQPLIVIAGLRAAPGSSYEVAARTGLAYHNCQPEIAQLRAFGAVEPSGTYALTPYAKKAIRWRLRDGPYRPGIPPKVLAALAEALAWQRRNTTPEINFSTCE